jgi:hypothetical protein
MSGKTQEGVRPRRSKLTPHEERIHWAEAGDRQGDWVSTVAKGGETACVMNDQTRPRSLPERWESKRIQVIVCALTLRERRLDRLPRERLT